MRAVGNEMLHGFKKSIEFFREEQYRELPYGTIYYVAGTATAELNACVKREARKIAKHMVYGLEGLKSKTF